MVLANSGSRGLVGRSRDRQWSLDDEPGSFAKLINDLTAAVGQTQRAVTIGWKN